MICNLKLCESLKFTIIISKINDSQTTINEVIQIHFYYL